jgi:hypothetical protein
VRNRSKKVILAVLFSIGLTGWASADCIVAGCQCFIRVGEKSLIDTRQRGSISPCFQCPLKNLATVLRIKFTAVQRQFIFKISLQKRINLSITAGSLPADICTQLAMVENA